MADFSVMLRNDLESQKVGLPQDLNIQRYVSNALALLNNNDGLKTYVKNYGAEGMSNIKFALVQGAYLGLDATNSEFYLVPYGKAINFTPSYKGYAKLCKKYSAEPVKEIYSMIVREGDEFQEEVVNGEPTIHFKPKPFNKGALVGVFAVCLYKDGTMIYETMSKEEIDTAKSKSKSGGAVWKTWYGEMAKKTCIRRLCKHITIDFESAEQRKIFESDTDLDFDPVEEVKNEVREEIETNANSVVFEVEE